MGDYLAAWRTIVILRNMRKQVDGMDLTELVR